VVIEPFLTDQWFVNAEVLAQPALEAVRDGRTKFVPQQYENTYFAWLENIRPWCISRQLWWGHRIPAWYAEDGRVFVAHSEVEAVRAAIDHYGRAEPLTRDPDVLDTWFSSALWPFSTMGWPDETAELRKYYPTDTVVTGFDIIFFWVARMMMMGLEFMGEVPFSTVYMHALVRDEKGAKMSKTKGNVIDPLGLIDSYGADATRFTFAAMAAQGRDLKLSLQRVEGYRNFVTKLWNAARFLEVNDCARVPGFDPKAATHQLNRWIAGATARAVADETQGPSQPPSGQRRQKGIERGRHRERRSGWNLALDLSQDPRRAVVVADHRQCVDPVAAPDRDRPRRLEQPEPRGLGVPVDERERDRRDAEGGDPHREPAHANRPSPCSACEPDSEHQQSPAPRVVDDRERVVENQREGSEREQQRRPP
jgi:hypothetical protein